MPDLIIYLFVILFSLLIDGEFLREKDYAIFVFLFHTVHLSGTQNQYHFNWIDFFGDLCLLNFEKLNFNICTEI